MDKTISRILNDREAGEQREKGPPEEDMTTIMTTTKETKESEEGGTIDATTITKTNASIEIEKKRHLGEPRPRKIDLSRKCAI